MLIGAEQAPAAEIFTPETHVQNDKTSSPALAEMPSDPPRCDVWLTKRISAKDSDARTFANLVGKLKQEHPGRTIYVCLDSEGGDLEEALKIAHYIILGGLDLTQTGT